MVVSHDGYSLVVFCLLLINAKKSIANGVFSLSAQGHLLKNSLIKEIKSANPIHCIQLCLQEGPRCMSVNYDTSSRAKENCQLNNATATECKLVNLVANKSFNYFERVVRGKPSFCLNPLKNGDVVKKRVNKSCADFYKDGEREDGVYTIDPDGQGAFEVRCDMTTNGGGWTVFQRRVDGSEDFYREWSDYKNGFGDLKGEFWLGLCKIHRLTMSGHNVLRVDLEDFGNAASYAEYTTFGVADEENKYRLSVGGFSGSAGDSLGFQSGMMFSTKDADNDRRASGNCAEAHKGAWWYNNCFSSHLNGEYIEGGPTAYAKGVMWHHWKGTHYSLKKSEMKTRPRQF